MCTIGGGPGRDGGGGPAIGGMAPAGTGRGGKGVRVDGRPGYADLSHNTQTHINESIYQENLRTVLIETSRRCW